MNDKIPADIRLAIKNQWREITTLGALLDWCAAYFNNHELFYGHGTDNPWDEAVALILAVLQLPIDSGREILDMPLTSASQDELCEAIANRVYLRMPVPYITHRAYFAGLSFYVDPQVLIPRSPLNELITDHFLPWKDPETIHHVLDLCTGSGCIALAIAHHLPHVSVDATDISPTALDIATKNAQDLALNERVHFIEADLFALLPAKTYDVIVANPPYVDAQDMAALPEEYWHEPRLGLTAGEDGLRFVIPILQQAHDYLNDEGILVVEVGNSEMALVERFPEIPFTWLEFECGGDGVFLLTKNDLARSLNLLKAS